VITLRGITWQHDRGLAPMLATASRFAETHPETRIDWEARSLQGFADSPIRHLAEEYDLIVLDHPFMGTVARGGYLVPLDKYVPPEVRASLRGESVGASHDSYFYDDHQWAFAIDAAAQVAGYRPDLLQAAGVTVPRTWDDVFALARTRRGFVTTPLLPVDALCSFFTLCASSGEPPFGSSSGKIVSDQTGEVALLHLNHLAECGAPESLEWSPIKVWEKMSATDEIAFCPLGFGYSNYARTNYRKFQLRFTNIPSFGLGVPARAVLGGAGLAISAQCKELFSAVTYAAWVASAECQRTLYAQSGGQPANKKAWTDSEVNRISHQFFEATLPTLEQAYVRPRFPGFVEFQTEASSLISDFLHGRNGVKDTLRLLDECYRGWRNQ
jgi:multiple sugar transport system substrate-binding protein